MENTEILIIGAGAAGLMAAFTLAKAGKRVIILEARSRAGGRMHTLNNTLFFTHAELGAEFVHGNLPVTLKILKEARIGYYPAHGEMWHYDKGKFDKEYQQADHWGLLMKRLDQLKTDTSIASFLEQHFAGAKYEELRKSVAKYVSGYDTADPFKASAFALRREWQHEDEDAQYRVSGGYGEMIGYLTDECRSNGAELYLNKPVKAIHWEHGKAEAITADGSAYQADKVIIALPLGVMKAGRDEEGAVSFSPAIPKYTRAIQQMGFGAIIKVLLEFKEAFWENEETARLAGNSLKEMGFLLSDEAVPTWWTQFPERSALLTGWLGGPNAEKKKEVSNEELLQDGIQSLANIFKRSVDDLKADLIAWNVVNWTAEPYTRGSYAYDTIEAPAARVILNTPVNNTLYFAGEYLYDGPAMGTVEAALTSGLETGKHILKAS